jgi:DNA repair exonuclease SbcCD nuclease subunit
MKVSYFKEINNKIMRILLIGDQHIKVDNIKIAKILCSRLKEFLKNKSFDMIVSMGDLLHTNERLHTIALNEAINYLQILASHSPTFVLVGNHDYINCAQYLSENHWLNCVKSVPNLTVVDKVLFLEKEGIKLVFSPFVPDSRFVESLNTIGDKWKTADCIFGHQLIDGGKMGATDVKNIEEWKEEYPLLMCGHIHEKQTISKNLRYVGSVLQHSFGEPCDKSITTVEITKDGIKFEEDYLELPKKETLYIQSSELDTLEPPPIDDNHQFKIVINGNEEEYKTFRQSQKFKKFRGIPIVFKYTRKQLEEKKENIKNKPSSNNFYDELYLSLGGNEELRGIFDMFVKK